MNRRAFLTRVAAVPLAVAALPVAKAAAPPLAFSSEAFARACDPNLSTRWVRQYDVHALQQVSRLDILYGIPRGPQLACQVADDLPAEDVE
jgi:hypothetical protein